ncbi:hypothetical protein DEU56DRAFT_749410 [Suillus clintonianus]|uniref:uncharacterized protein n=1 Tax=Suillus clintonianus TaxID=1904413 RepID=UPI001B86E0FE|nr:uncharacterized protein DEU56DRAFT_749410 [Suillus clintonianus]KAG2112112.1 hypothetical protein DEU56DRAFT_749410 [Suillus clintonianus]
MTRWVDDREKYFMELIRLEGRGDYATREACHGHRGCAFEPEYRCKDCFGTELYCKDCTVERHRDQPLHRIERWNGYYFEETTLKHLGLRIQLGHAVGERCFNPSKAFDDGFVILDIDRVHQVALDFCGCSCAQSHVTQILRARLYPATCSDPKSAATFRLLQHFQMLTFESKVSAFKYWQTVSRLTDNTGIKPCKYRYESLLRMIKQWRNITLLKRFGRGHDPAGINATELGGCAVLCPACPHPGKNLPEDWKMAPPDKQWLYAQYFAIDANFRLVRKNVSSDSVDPGLSKGWAYFVEETGFKLFLKDVGKVSQEKSTCVSHNAVNLAETKNSRGLAATGAGTVDCSRHNFKRPCGVGDLQRGEKYVNMDYLFFSTVQHSSEVIVLNVSYDIACQWSKNIWTRMSKYPSRLHFERDGKTMTFLVPKFHLPAHITACQTSFSHNLIKGMGRTDGEAPERGWANINPVATSTREMGPGARRDTLDDHFGYYNWKKFTNFGISLLSKIKTAIPEREQHQRDFDEFNCALTNERPSEVVQWKEVVESWESDRSSKNPFEITTVSLTLAAVRLKLSQQEAQDLENGLNNSLHTDISPSVLISSGIDLEEQQYRLRQDMAALSAHPTDLQLTKLQERSNALLRKIEQWCNIQLLYMPGVGRLRAIDTANAQSVREEKAHEVMLWLPSKVKETTELCEEPLCAYKLELRRAQAHEALDDLRRQLRLRTHLYKFKDTHIRGQRANTRASTVLNKVEHTIKTAVARYRRAWSAIKTLSAVLGKPNWEVELPELQLADVRGMAEGETGQSEGKRTLSWIWKTCGVAGVGEDGEAVLSEGLRIEWCKSRARANRWAEEVELLQEEMRRVADFLAWHAGWWEKRANWRTVPAAPEQEGLQGYAKRQAALRRAMRVRFQEMWSVVPALLQSPSPGMDPPVL